MIAAARIVLSAVLFFLPITAQTPAKATASIAGRISIGAQPAAGVEVVLKRGGDLVVNGMEMDTPPITTTTDSEGRYRISNLAAGKYRITAYAPAFVIEGENRSRFQFGKIITLAEGEALANIDFNMVRGGVITGRVTDENGRPVIAEAVGAFRLDENGKRTNDFAAEMAAWITDDRGVYRIYGLDPGQYVVGAGASIEDSMLRMGGGKPFKRTYHPETPDETKAEAIELKPGAEVENVDIKLARATKGFVASGRVIEAETGKGVPGIMIGYAVTKPNTFSMGMGNSATNSNGEFQLEGLSPNTYLAFLMTQPAGESYGTQARFEIRESDVTGLEIKVVPGGEIRGVAVVEGVTDPAILAGLGKIQVSAYKKQAAGAEDMWANMGTNSTAMINANGAFRITGVPEGRVLITPAPDTFPPGFIFERLERSGNEIRELDIAKGERISDLRLIFAYGTASLAGRIEFKGNALPANAKIWVTLRPEAAAAEEWLKQKNAPVDTRGQFLLEGLRPGNYSLGLYVDDGRAPISQQNVVITGPERQEIIMTVDRTKKGEER